MLNRIGWRYLKIHFLRNSKSQLWFWNEKRFFLFLIYVKTTSNVCLLNDEMVNKIFIIVLIWYVKALFLFFPWCFTFQRVMHARMVFTTVSQMKLALQHSKDWDTSAFRTQETIHVRLASNLLLEIIIFVKVKKVFYVFIANFSYNICPL